MNPDRSISKIQALGALLLLVLLVVGAPLAILVVFGWPFTRGILHVQRWPHALTATELSDDAVQRVIVAVALVLLAYLLGCVLSEVGALLRRVDRSTRYHNPLSQWVRNLVAVSAVLVSTARTVPAFSLPATAPVAAGALPAPQAAPPASRAGGLHAVTGLPAPGEGLVVTAAGTLADGRDHRPGTSVVEAGRRDTLYSMAVRHLGDGNRRDELLELNRGRAMPDGTLFDGTVRPGYPLLVPVAAGADAAASAATSAAVADAAVADAGAPHTYVVQPGDSLWSIAERLLGDGERYPELHDANLGREVAPGIAFLSTTTVIHPGWELVVPAADLAAPAAAATTVTAAHEHVVTPGESVWSIATDEVAATDGPDAGTSEVAPYVARTIEANVERFVHPGHPELIVPGQSLVLPPVHGDRPTAAPAPAAAPAAGAEPAAPAAEAEPAAPAADASAAAAPTAAAVTTTSAAPLAVSAVPAAAPSAPVAADASATDDASGVGDDGARPAWSGADGDSHAVAVTQHGERDVTGLIGAAVSAAGALAVLHRLRHRRLNRRRPGSRVVAPPADVAWVERVLRAQADVELCRWAPRAFRHLGPRLVAEWDGSYPMVASAALTADVLTVTWTAPRPTVVEPWRVVDPEGHRWELPRGAGDSEVADGVVPPCPALVTVGTDTAAPVLVDLEAAGFVSVTGPPERVADFGRALAFELAVTDFADLLDIRLVGLPDDGFEHLHRVHAVASLAQALAWARPLRAGTDELLADNGVDSLFELRARQGATAVTHEPLVLVIAPTLADADGLAELRALCEPGRGVAAVVLGSVEAPVTVHLSDDGTATVRLPDADAATVAASQVPADTLERVAALLDHAAAADEHPVPITLPTRRDEPFADLPGSVEVRLLGPVAAGPLHGADWPDIAPKSLELLAWLATHPGPQPAERVRVELWPVRDASARNLNNQMSAVRTLLGADTAGTLLLPPTSDDIYRLSDAVVTDLGCLERRVQWAATAADASAITVLREGLTIVRGRPFSARTGYDWAFADQLVFQAEQLVVDAAHRLGELSLVAGDPNGAVWATAAGLRGRPGDETLYQLRMRAFAAMGNRASLRLAMNELCTQLQDLAGVDEPSEETTELFEQLMGRERSA